MPVTLRLPTVLAQGRGRHRPCTRRAARTVGDVVADVAAPVPRARPAAARREGRAVPLRHLLPGRRGHPVPAGVRDAGPGRRRDRRRPRDRGRLARCRSADPRSRAPAALARTRSSATAGTSSSRRSASRGSGGSRPRASCMVGAGGLGSPIGALPRGSRRRPPRDRRVRRRRRDEPAAPGAARHEGRRPQEGRVGPRPDPRPEPARRGRSRTRRWLTSENALEIIREYDLVVDGTDNFATRYLVNDACVLLGKPNVYGSIFRFEGQSTVFCTAEGPCYRCLYPEPPPPGLVPSCAEGGVLGILPGLVGLDPGDRDGEAHRAASASRSSAGSCSWTRSRCSSGP